MKYPVYCVRDTKVGFDTQFIVQANESAAVRGFTFMVNNPGNMPSFAPSDFELYQIGEFETDSGVFTAVIPAQFIVNGASLIGAKDNA